MGWHNVRAVSVRARESAPMHSAVRPDGCTDDSHTIAVLKRVITVTAVSGALRLGVFVQDRARSILVVSDDGEAAVALRDHVARHEAIVRDVRPSEFGDAVAACLPWPWM